MRILKVSSIPFALGLIALGAFASETARAATDSTLAELWVLDLFAKGGLVMWPITICSIIGMAIVFEKFFALRSSRVCPRLLVEEICSAIAKDTPKDAARALERSEKVAIARIIGAGLEKSATGADSIEIETAIQTRGAIEAVALQSNLRALGALANLTPMLGLLGTVIGMIKAFNVISISGAGDPGLVATGISEALITTASGLIVGISALAAYHYLRGKVDRLIFEMESASARALDAARDRDRLSGEERAGKNAEVELASHERASVGAR